MSFHSWLFTELEILLIVDEIPWEKISLSKVSSGPALVRLSARTLEKAFFVNLRVRGYVGTNLQDFWANHYQIAYKETEVYIV